MTFVGKVRHRFSSFSEICSFKPGAAPSVGFSNKRLVAEKDWYKDALLILEKNGKKYREIMELKGLHVVDMYFVDTH